jgi:hypothetical protein
MHADVTKHDEAVLFTPHFLTGRRHCDKATTTLVKSAAPLLTRIGNIKNESTNQTSFRSRRLQMNFGFQGGRRKKI